MIGAMVGVRAERRAGLMLKMSEALSGLSFCRCLVIVSRLMCCSRNCGGRGVVFGGVSSSSGSGSMYCGGIV